MSLAPITVAIHTLGRTTRQDLLDDVVAGLSAPVKTLPSRWFYDDPGCELYELITDLPEYYQTRTEMEILRLHAGEIVAATRTASIVELGAGACAKSRLLIRAARGAGTLWTFIPFDISETTIRRSAAALVEEFEDLTVYCVAGEFNKHLDQIPRLGTQLVVFLGSTIGNFDVVESARFLGDIRRLMKPGDAFLLGVDLVKDERELVAAYDDAQGVTARFNLNLLARINRELGGDFDIASFRHEARWNPDSSRIEMHLRSLRQQSVTIPDAGRDFGFEKGETILTELCTKYTRDDTEAMFEAAGLALREWYTDPARRFAVALGE
jgi:L-histidine Nalpha-methyltransferase